MADDPSLLVMVAARRRLLLALGAIALLLALASLSGPDRHPFLVAAEQVRTAFALPGGVVAYGTPGRAPIVHAFGHADARSNERTRPEDRFKVASLSKPVTAAAVLELVRRGDLDLDARLVELVPGAADAVDPRVQRITLRQLLRHSAGWDRSRTFDPFFLTPPEFERRFGRRWTVEDDCLDIVRQMGDLPLQFEPGRRYAYANIGYCWLGEVLVHVGGAAYADVVVDLVPEAARFSLEVADVTVRHAVAAEARELPIDRPRVAGPFGGWIADVASYFAFAARRVDPRTLDRPSYAPGLEYYGLGWRVWRLDGNVLLTHYGAMPGVFSVVIKIQNGPVYVALFNGRPSNDRAAFEFLLRSVVDVAESAG